MANQEDVKKSTAEETVETDSSSVESEPQGEVETADSQPQKETPADASIEPEKEVSKTVPYERFKEVNEKLKELESQREFTPQPEVVQQPATDLPFDEETQRGLDAYNDRRDAERFVSKHGTELKKDPVLDGAVRRIIAEESTRGAKVIDREAALTKAHEVLDRRFKSELKKAQTEGFEEGQEVARKKKQADAVGKSGPRQEVDPDTLSAKEFAEYKEIPRTN